MTELKPCPFCGHRLISRNPRYDSLGTDDEYYVIQCDYCQAMVHSESYDEVIEVWNRRASETPGEISDGEGLRLIADGGEYKVFATQIGDKTYYLLKGHPRTDYLFSEAQWDQYARVIAYADIKIRGGIE